MAQIRQRHVNIQVTSQDPTNKVFKGIYADSEHTMLLSSNKSYEFDINSGQSKELYIRYSQKPVTIIFKGVAEGSYKVTGNFGEVNVSSEDVTANVEFLTDTSPYVDVAFSSIESTTEGYGVGDIEVGGALVHSLPYYLQNAVPGQQIEVNVEISETTTTTTSSTTPPDIALIIKEDDYTSELYPCKVDITGGYYVGAIFTINGPLDIIPLSLNTQYRINRIEASNYQGVVDILGIHDEPNSIPYVFVTPPNSDTISITVKGFLGTTTSTPAPAVLKLQSNADGTVVRVTSDGIDPKEVSLADTTQSSVVIGMNGAPLVDA